MGDARQLTFGAIGAVLVAAVVFSNNGPSNIGTLLTGKDPSSYAPGEWSRAHVVREPIEVIEWKDRDQRFTQALLKEGRPVVLRGTKVEDWAARSKWSQEYLRNHPDIQTMKLVKTGTEKMFYDLDTEAEMVKHGMYDTSLHYNVSDMTAKDFFSKINDPDDPNFYYWYGPIVQLDGILHRDVQPWDYAFLSAKDADKEAMFMWMSGAGPRAWIHADSDHNFFIHMLGTKRFIVFPPSEYENLYMYSRLHPKWHKSQVNFDAPDLDRFPRFANATAYEALLQPGDVLYVPQYWWHYVESVTPCVSLATWSKGDVWDPMAEVYSRDMIFDGEENKTRAISATKHHIHHLLAALYGEETVTDHINRIVRDRWAPTAHLYDIDTVTPEQCAALDKHAKFYKRDVDAILPSFRRIPEPLRTINVYDYVEMTGGWASGPADMLSYFITCFGATMA